MTEEQAKTKWCPQARVAGMDGPGGNRHVLHADGLNGADRCIASACMAWRLLEDRHEYVDLPIGEEPEGEGWESHGEGFEPAERAWSRKLTNRGGYCGLAGQPS